MKTLLLVVLSVIISSCAGSDGLQGLSGPAGPIGTPGTDLTPITIVNFCPGTTTYPSTFIELGFCINNKVYAVYSANNGLLVEVVPGNYNSNSIGSSCNFAVLDNCVIQH